MNRVLQGWGLVGLALCALLALLAALLAGSVELSPARALAAIGGGGDELARTIMQTVRVPRALSAFAVGAQLALAGVLLQALFRNPLADPFVLGVSGGAAIGALGGMLAGAGLALLQWYATAGALLVGVVVVLLGSGGSLLRLLLAGVVLASFCGALSSVLLAIADNGQLRGMVFWLAGDLGWATQPRRDLLLVAVCAVLAIFSGRSLNVLAAGELRSASLGLHPARTRLLVFAVGAVLTAAAVLAAGPIGFVGLVAPHLVRLALRTSDHRLVAPGAALCGGALLCLADAVSRTVAAPRQLPVGAVTAILGAPLFLWLLRRQSSG
jgi:iron complex transport system permease protein